MRRRIRPSSPLLASPTSNPKTSRVVRRLRRSAESSSTISNLPCESSMLDLHADMRQRKKERCTCFRIAFNPHPTSVRLSNSFCYRQADTSSGGLMLRPGGAIKALKDPQPLFRGNKRSFVLHVEHNLSIG